MTARAFLAFTLAATGVAVAHCKRPATHLPSASAPIASSDLPPHVSRSWGRRPLPARSASPLPRRQGHLTLVDSYADTTMYCSTGSRNAAGLWPHLGDVAVIDRSIRFGTRLLIAGREYVVRDWIGSGSQFDVFGGDDAGCEQRALTFGRRHLRVVEVAS